ncbi:hypothetical protein [Candidatus Pantoea bituminis]|uniref:hypothetical protein n=1 Tax=Candidatus Pantoea bituminis TaxID=2831036 RepID=UPI001C060C9F|nr:hypothetical protein [Pantoea bituminis]
MGHFTRRYFLKTSALLAFATPSLTVKAKGNSPLPLLTLAKQWIAAPEDWIPNHPSLPVMHFRATNRMPEAQHTVLTRLTHAGWHTQWKSVPFSYQHFHSKAHAIFVVAAGNGKMQLGGERGEVIHVAQGDLLFCQPAPDRYYDKAAKTFRSWHFTPTGSTGMYVAVVCQQARRKNNQLFH